MSSGDPGRWLPLRLWFHIALFFGLSVAAVFVLWAIFRGVFPGALKDELKVEVIRLILYIIAGLGGVFALVIAYRRQGQNEAAEKRIERAEDREDTKLFNERFKSATEQLSSEQAASRLAGVYALAGLADDWDAGRQTCIDVLCGYIRMPLDPPGQTDGPEDEDWTALPEAAGQAHKRHKQELQVRRTIVNAIASRLRAAPADGTWHGCDFDFSGATVTSALFEGIRLEGGVMDFTGSKFFGNNVDFRGAKVSGGRLDFRWAVFHGGSVNFMDAVVTGGRVDFRESVFHGGDIILSGGEFAGGTLDFRRVAVHGGRLNCFAALFGGALIDFKQSRFYGAELNFFAAGFLSGKATFSNADLHDVEVDITWVTWDGGILSFKDPFRWELVRAGFPDGLPPGLHYP